MAVNAGWPAEWHAGYASAVVGDCAAGQCAGERNWRARSPGAQALDRILKDAPCVRGMCSTSCPVGARQYVPNWTVPRPVWTWPPSAPRVRIRPGRVAAGRAGSQRARRAFLVQTIQCCWLLLRNLIENALKHPARTRIAVQMGDGGGERGAWLPGVR